jgi:hypothetical protein
MYYLLPALVFFLAKGSGSMAGKFILRSATLSELKTMPLKFVEK